MSAMNIIKIPTDLPLHHFVKAEQLVDDTFGEGMFFKQTWDNSVHQWIIIEGGYYHDQVVSYCSAQIKQEGLLGILKTSVVSPERQGHGIGDFMVKHRIKWLQEQGVQTIKSYAWFVDGRVPAQKMLMNNDFKPTEDIRGYWSEDHNAGFPCKICGEKCKCVARIFEYEK